MVKSKTNILVLLILIFALLSVPIAGQQEERQTPNELREESARCRRVAADYVREAKEERASKNVTGALWDERLNCEWEADALEYEARALRVEAEQLRAEGKEKEANKKEIEADNKQAQAFRKNKEGCMKGIAFEKEFLNSYRKYAEEDKKSGDETGALQWEAKALYSESAMLNYEADFHANEAEALNKEADALEKQNKPTAAKKKSEQAAKEKRIAQEIESKKAQKEAEADKKEYEAEQKKEEQGRATTPPGTRLVKLPTAKGDLNLILPDDIRPGDTISGTVVGEPEEFQDTVGGVVIGEERKELKKVLNYIVPAAALTLPIILQDRHGNEITRQDITVCPIEPKEPALALPEGLAIYAVAPVGIMGKTATLSGIFDGSIDTTKVQVAGLDAELLCESPRKVVFKVPKDLIPGETTLTVEDTVMGRKISEEHKLNLLTLRLTVDTTTIRTGQTTTVTATINGLERLKTKDFPIPVEFTNLTPTRVHWKTAPGTIVKKEITQDRVVNGVCTFQEQIVGIIPGAFKIFAKVRPPEPERKEPFVRSFSLSEAEFNFTLPQSLGGGTKTATAKGDISFWVEPVDAISAAMRIRDINITISPVELAADVDNDGKLDMVNTGEIVITSERIDPLGSKGSINLQTGDFSLLTKFGPLLIYLKKPEKAFVTGIMSETGNINPQTLAYQATATGSITHGPLKGATFIAKMKKESKCCQSQPEWTCPSCGSRWGSAYGSCRSCGEQSPEWTCSKCGCRKSKGTVHCECQH